MPAEAGIQLDVIYLKLIWMASIGSVIGASMHHSSRLRGNDIVLVMTLCL